MKIRNQPPDGRHVAKAGDENAVSARIPERAHPAHGFVVARGRLSNLKEINVGSRIEHEGDLQAIGGLTYRADFLDLQR